MPVVETVKSENVKTSTQKHAFIRDHCLQAKFESHYFSRDCNMKIRTFPIILMTIISIWSCDQDIVKNEAQIDFYWDQTKCSDPWGTGENDSNLETEAALMEYLKNEGIEAIDIEFNNNSELDPGCESCGSYYKMVFLGCF